jgi:hypothetical protein
MVVGWLGAAALGAVGVAIGFALAGDDLRVSRGASLS